MSHDMQQQKPKKGDGLALLFFVASVHITCFSVFTRRRFGAEALGLHGICALGLMLLITPSEPGMIWWIALWIVALVCQRISTFRSLRKGEVIHSRDTGYPWLAMKFPFVWSEYTAVTLMEPLLCFVAGSLVISFSQPIGVFMMLGTVSHITRFAIDHEITRKRLQSMQDAELEQRYYSEQFRQRRRF